MLNSRARVGGQQPSASAKMPPRPGYGLVMVVAGVVLVVTTAATAWFSTGLVAPGLPGPQQAPLESAAVKNQTRPPQTPTNVTRRAAAKPAQAKTGDQSKENTKTTQALAVVPAAALPAPSRKPEVEEVLVIPVPKSGEGRVFGAADPGVSPPVLISPRLNSPLQQEEGTANLCAIDLVVSDKGEVESVKLASPVRDYREAMMLSAVKAWRFKPASVDGLRVRYQLRIHISVTSVATGNR